MIATEGGETGPSHALLYTLIALMVFFWSANFIVGKVALRQFPPLLLSGLRVAGAGLLMAPIYAWQHARLSGEVWTRSDLPVLVYLGMFGVALNQLFFVVGLNRTSVAHSAIVIAMTPICVLLIAALLRQEHITARKVFGMALAMAGVAVLNIFPASETGAGGPTLLGDFFVFLASLTFALFTVVGKKVSLQHSAITVNTFAFVGGAVALAPVTLWQSHGFRFAAVSSVGWLSLVYMALFPSVACYLIYYYALKHVSASRVAAFSYLQPVLATILATFTLHEPVTPPLVAGGAIIFTGVYLTERG